MPTRSKLKDVQLAELKPLIEQFAGQIPRYTSYPTALEFKDIEGKLRPELKNDGPLSVYTHIPFCPSLCYFCACNKIITRDADLTTPYIAALKKELEIFWGDRVCERDVVHMHWGGGTPNFLKPDEILEVSAAFKERFPKLVGEVSVEIDPRTLTEEHLIAFKEAGFNRVSFGVQDLDPEVQQLINRVQPLEQTANVIAWSRKLGFKGVNVDLIYGLPNQTRDGFIKTVREIIALRPERIAMYGYAHVTWISKAQKSFERAHLPTPEERLELLYYAVQEFVDAGYDHIGIDHFALPEDSLSIAHNDNLLTRNFMGYTPYRDVEILAYGVSSISDYSNYFIQNSKDLPTYYSRIEKGELPYERVIKLKNEDGIRGELIRELLCYGETILPSSMDLEYELEKLKELEFLGLVNLHGNKLEIMPKGVFFARNIAAIFDTYLASRKKLQSFSQAV